MAAATESRKDTVPLAGLALVDEFTIYAAEKTYKGIIAARDYTDEVHMASDTSGLRVIGVSNELVDNTDDGEVLKQILRGIFRFNNSSTYIIPRSAIGQVCYVEDDNTVASWSTNLVAAGIVHDVDSAGVWVDMRPEALVMAHEMRPPALAIAKTDDYTVTAALAFDARNYWTVSKSSLATLTLPSAVAGMRIGVKRLTAGAGYDVSVQAGTGDRIQASDAICAASKKIDNTVDAISGILWLRAVDDTFWMIDNPIPNDVGSWVVNNT